MNKIPYLDTAKTVGILAIITTHIHGVVRFTHQFADAIWYVWVSRAFHVLGHYGVSLFIVTSGFGLYWSILHTHTSWLAWVKKRGIKIFTLFWISYAFFIIVLVLLPRVFPIIPVHLIGIKEFLLTLTGLQAYIGIWGGSLNPVYWFNSLIIGLSVFFPLIVYLFKKFPPITILTIVGITSLVASLIILQYSWEYFRLLPITRLSEFTFGMYMAHTVYLKQISKVPSYVYLLMVALIFIGYVLTLTDLSTTILVLSSGPLLFLAFQNMSIQTHTMTTFFAKYSHALYLFHLPILMLYQPTYTTSIFLLLSLMSIMILSIIGTTCSQLIEFKLKQILV